MRNAFAQTILVTSLSIILLILLIQCGPSKAQNEESPTKSQQLFQDLWKWKTSNSPELSTKLGIHDYDEFLNDYSEAAILNRRTKALEFISRAEQLESDKSTSEDDRLNLRILKDIYIPYTDRIANQSFYFIINKAYGMHRRIHRRFKAMPLKTLSDYETMLKRMEKIPTQISQIIDLMKEGVRKGITYHQLSMNDFNSTLTKFLVSDPKDSIFYQIFTTNLSSLLTEQEKKDLQDRCQHIIKTGVTHAFKKLGHYITKNYQTRPEVAVGSIPDGKNYYQHCAKYYTSTSLTPQEIHNIGLKEVDRIELEMKEIIQQLGFKNMTVKEFSDMIRNDPNNYHKTTEEVLTEFRRICYDVIPPKLPNLFTTINKDSMAFTIEGDPLATSAYYSGPSLDGSRPGTFFVPTFNIRPKYSMMTLSLHEVSPGHHFHYTYLANLPNFPKFRRTGGQVFFSEGWALYAEKLGFELDLYGDLLDRYGHLTAEMFRACRLVVDTGIHALNWTAEQAIEYMFQRLAKLRATLEKEVYRYITKPGQALAYKMGEIKIKELRKNAENTLSGQFNIKEFHDIVLSSFGGSMEFLEERVKAWIKQKAP